MHLSPSKIFVLVSMFTLLGVKARINNYDKNIIVTTNEDYMEIPPHTDYARMARFIVHKSNWGAMGSLSTLSEIQGFPMVNVISIADSQLNSSSTGRIYFFLTTLDFTGQDLRKQNKLTMLLSMDQDLSCSKQGIDPMEPTCPRIMITGRANVLKINTENYTFGNSSMFSRHPSAANWTRAHNFFLCQLYIQQIAVLDYYGGPHFVTPEEYYNAKIDNYNFNFE